MVTDPEQNRFDAFQHPLRRRVMAVMLRSADGVSPAQLSDALLEPLSTVAYHVRVLARLNAVSLTGEVPVRGAVEHTYRLADLIVGTRWATESLEAIPTPDAPPPLQGLPLDTETFERHAASVLDPREREIVAMHHGFDEYGKRPRKAIAADLGIPEEEVRQIERTAIHKLQRERDEG